MWKFEDTVWVLASKVALDGERSISIWTVALDLFNSILHGLRDD
jgi:hypothetical protein